EEKMEHETKLQQEFITWEISLIAMFAGGVLAGSNTFNGLKQGLIVGLCTGVILCGLRAWAPSGRPPELFPLSIAGITVPEKNQPLAQIFTLAMLTALLTGAAGGWFGSQLLPPVLATPRRKYYGPGSIT